MRFLRELGGLLADLGRGMRLRRRCAGGRKLRALGRVRINRTGRGAVLRLGEHNWIYDGVHFFLDGDGAEVTIGDRSGLNRRVEIMCMERITIGADTFLSWDVMVADSDFHKIGPGPATAPVTIGDRVLIGARAIILKGVTIGDGAVVAAGALVSSDVPPGALVAGVPAKVVRENISWEI